VVLILDVHRSGGGRQGQEPVEDSVPVSENSVPPSSSSNLDHLSASCTLDQYGCRLGLSCRGVQDLAIVAVSNRISRATEWPMPWLLKIRR